LYSVVGSFGIPVLINDNQAFVFQRHIAILRPNTDVILPEYLYYTMLSDDFYHKADHVAIGAAQRTISLSSLRNMEIEVPPIEIQRHISSTLKAFDLLYSNNKKRIRLLEEAAQRLYKEWFVDLHFPGYENVIIENRVPDGWKSTTLETVLSKITTGLNPRKNFVLGKGVNYYVTIKNMADNNVYLDDKCDRIDNDALKKINSRSDLRTGDILFSGIGTMGRVYLISIPTDNWNVSESVFTMRNNDNISKELLYLILLSPEMQGYCDTHAHGVAQKGIRMADLKAFEFILPSAPVIAEFTDKVKPIIEMAQKLQRENASLLEARKRLLPKLMNGEIEI